MASLAFWAASASVVVLLIGLGIAGVQDWRRREVDWEIWGVMGTAGVIAGGIEIAPGGARPLLVWLLVGALLLQHFVAWDDWLGPEVGAYADYLEFGAYGAVVVVVVAAAARYGVGPTGVPLAAVVLLGMIVLARLLFQLNVLYGAADAQALMVASALVPVFPTPWLFAPHLATVALAFLPFSLSMLTNAALFSLAIPVYLAARNLSRGEFAGLQGFLGYSLPVRELPDRFVWVRDPAAPAGRQEDLETAEEDRAARIELARELEAKGISRVWVGPQIPLVTVMAVGALAALLGGNLLLDLLVR